MFNRINITAVKSRVKTNLSSTSGIPLIRYARHMLNKLREARNGKGRGGRGEKSKYGKTEIYISSSQLVCAITRVDLTPSLQIRHIEASHYSVAGLFLATRNPLRRSFGRNKLPRARLNTLVSLKEIHFAGCLACRSLRDSFTR